MELLKFVRLLVVIVSMVSGKRFSEAEMKHLKNEQLNLLTKGPRQGELMCDRLSKQPYFGVEMLLGPTWRIYYTWNIDLQNQCLDMLFRNATPQIIKRIYNDMNEFLETEPYWDAATVLLSMGRAKHEMLLFADQVAAGRFLGVPNIVGDGGMTTSTKSVPMLKFHLKLLYGGKYLLMSDCQIGVTTLSARRHSLPYRAEIGGVADSLGFGPGIQACQSDKNKNEDVPKDK